MWPRPTSPRKRTLRKTKFDIRGPDDDNLQRKDVPEYSAARRYTSERPTRQHGFGEHLRFVLLEGAIDEEVHGAGEEDPAEMGEGVIQIWKPHRHANKLTLCRLNGMEGVSSVGAF